MARLLILTGQTISAASAGVILVGCASQETPAPSAASHKPMLKVNLSAKPKNTAQPTSSSHQFKFRKLLSDEAGRENRPAQPQGGGGPGNASGPWSRYDPQRLAKVAQVHEWWPVDGPEAGFQVHLRTQWREGKLNVNVLIVGPVVNINRFVSSIKSIQLIITDVNGNALANWDLYPNDFEWASNDGNSGTLVFRTSVEFPLETYEMFQSWSFLWTNP
jgi:hypothetical protein